MLCDCRTVYDVLYAVVPYHSMMSLKCQRHCPFYVIFNVQISVQKCHGIFSVAHKKLDIIDVQHNQSKPPTTIASLTMSGTTAKLDEYVTKADATLAQYSSVTQYGEFHSNH